MESRRERRDRTAAEFLRKGAAVLLVLVSVTVGIVGLGLLMEGRLPGTGLKGRALGAAFIAATPVGIWAATRVTPEGGTSGYCDKNL